MSTLVPVSPYRWVVLTVFMLLNLFLPVLWICYAPIASGAAQAYGVSTENIDLLATLFLIIYVPMAWPAAWAVDKFDLRAGVGFGAVLLAVFSSLRAAFPTNYTAALVGSIGLSLAQPFVLTALVKLTNQWFPPKNRATVTGFMFIANLVGAGFGQAATPAIFEAAGFAGMQTIYAACMVTAAVLFLLFARSRPKLSTGPSAAENSALMLDGLRNLLRNKDIYLLSIMLLLCSTIYNSIFIMIEGFSAEKQFAADQRTLLIPAMLLGGIVGSFVLPAISDRLRRRKAVIVAATLLGGIIVIAIMLTTNFMLSLVECFLLGCMITGMLPVAYQYGVEAAFPTPAGTSNGLFTLVLQSAGFLLPVVNFVTASFQGSYVPAFLGLGVLIALSGLLATKLRESPDMKTLRS